MLSIRCRKPFVSALLLLAACAPAPEPAWPEGTVFVMDGQPILAAEIDAMADPLAEVGPSFTLPHRRRVVLTEVLIPRARARFLYPAKRTAALERLEQRRLAIESGAEPPPEPVIGNWSTIGMLTWLALRDTPVGEWSKNIEGAGTHARAKLISRDENPLRGRETFECWLLWEDYADPPLALDPASFGGELEVVAEDADTWRAVLPTTWLYELERPNR